MGDADDIKELFTKATKKWTRQRKTEEHHSGAVRYRSARLTRKKEMSVKEAAAQVMEDAYMKASANDTLPANARQIMYAARGEIQKLTDKPLDDQYFTQVLLPDYIAEHGVAWDVAYDDRGHFVEPHTEEAFGLGTLNVRGYLSQIREPRFESAKFTDAKVDTYGPQGNYGAVLFIEKEGFMSLFKETKLAERFDIAIMSTKGVSVTAARKLIDQVCGKYNVPLLVLHDFDVAGFTILNTLFTDTRRYSFGRPFGVIDLGLRLADVKKMDLESEEAAEGGGSDARISARLAKDGATSEEIEFLLTSRVELNAMASDEFMEFIEGKLEEHGIKKIIPVSYTLRETYTLFAEGEELKAVFAKAQKTFEAKAVEVPEDLEARVKQALEDDPEMPWPEAVHRVVNPDLPRDDKDKNEENDDEDEEDDE
jgi:hypothetical protein